MDGHKAMKERPNICTKCVMCEVQQLGDYCVRLEERILEAENETRELRRRLEFVEKD